MRNPDKSGPSLRLGTEWLDRGRAGRGGIRLFRRLPRPPRGGVETGSAWSITALAFAGPFIGGGSIEYSFALELLRHIRGRAGNP